MDIELLHSAATPIEHADDAGLIATACTVTVRDKDGATVETPAATLPTAATTTAAATESTITLTSTTGFAVGDPIQIVSDGVTYTAKIARIDGSVVHLLSGLPLAVDNGSTVKLTKITASVAAPGSTKIGDTWQVEFSYTDAASVRGFAVYEAQVVRWLFTGGATAEDVRDVLALAYQDERSEQFCAQVADRVNAKVKNALEASGRRAHLYAGGGSVFSEAVQAGIRWVLAELGVAPMGDLVSTIREFRFAFGDETTRVIASLKGYDSDADGKVTGAERTIFYTLRGVR